MNKVKEWLDRLGVSVEALVSGKRFPITRKEIDELVELDATDILDFEVVGYAELPVFVLYARKGVLFNAALSPNTPPTKCVIETLNRVPELLGSNKAKFIEVPEKAAPDVIAICAHLDVPLTSRNTDTFGLGGIEAGKGNTYLFLSNTVSQKKKTAVGMEEYLKQHKLIS